VIDELKASGAILFIDEVHMLVELVLLVHRWMRRTFSNQPYRVENCKSSVRRRWTSIANISRVMPPLERRFQPIMVDEPNVEGAGNPQGHSFRL
jgi:hypothetical protein